MIATSAQGLEPFAVACTLGLEYFPAVAAPLAADLSWTPFAPCESPPS